MKKNYLYIGLMSLLSVLAFTNCSDDDDVKSANVTIYDAILDGKIRYLTVKDNETKQLKAFIMPQDANAKVSYQFAGEKNGAFDITPDGLITPLVKTPATGDIPSPLGVDTILVMVNNNPNITVKYPVRIVSHIVMATGITIKPEGQNAELEKGKTLDLSKHITINPAKEVTEKEVLYSSSDESIAKIDANGLITTYAPGQVIITVTSTGRKGVSESTTLTVVDKITGPMNFDRTGWEATPSYTPNIENAGKPNENGRADQMLDGDNGTFFSIAKPGKLSVAPGTECSVVIDMKEEKDVEFFKIRHRNGTITLRVKEVSIYGSTDGTNFTLVKDNLAIPNVEIGEVESGVINLPKTKMRYFKMVYTGWDAVSSNTMQIAELNIGYIIPE